jgi:alanine dehydrogenase
MVVTEEMVSNMRPGSVVIDVSIDRGGCFETSEITSHEHPVFFKIRGHSLLCSKYSFGFARTASQAISNVLMPLLMEAGDEGGFENLVWHHIHLRGGIYLFKVH